MRTTALLGLAFALSIVEGEAQDTLIVRADNPPVWGDGVSLVEELRIGRIEGDSTEVFGRVTGVAITDDGEIWIADGQIGTLRRFSSDGEHVGSVGRRGEGPGEFAGSNIGLAILSSGSVAAFDAHEKRVSIFDAEGHYLSGWMAQIGCVPGRGTSLRSNGADRLYLRACGEWVVTDPSGAVIEMMSLPSMEDVPPGRSLPFGRMAPYVPRPVAAMSPLGYLVSGRTDSYALHRRLRDGRVVRLEREWTHVPVSSEERDQFAGRLAALSQRLGRAGASGGYNVSIPLEKPPLWAIHVDQQGRIWVARHVEGSFRTETPSERRARENLLPPTPPPMEWWEPLTTDLIEPNGRFLGTVTFPVLSTAIVWAKNLKVWVLEEGEYGEQYLVRYQIVPAE